MAVYVDDMKLPADVPNGNKVVSSEWSHMTADSHEELMAAAKALRLNPRWIQHPGTPLEHFDLTSGKRLQAIHQHIARPIAYGDTGRKSHAKREASKAPVKMSPQDFDLKAGHLFKAGEFTEARKVLGEALRQYPGDKEKWFERLATISAKDPDTLAAAIRVLKDAGMLPQEKEEYTLPVPSPLLPAGVHRENGGPTTQAMFGVPDRAPDPGPSHYCIGCTSVTMQNGREVYHGPRIDEHEALCQGCEVLTSMGRETPQMAEVIQQQAKVEQREREAQ